MSAAKKAKGLGRGLDALLGPGPAEAGREAPGAPTPRERAKLPIEHLAPDPNQPRRRFNEDALGELAQSIRARGLLQPILVRPDGENRYRIVAGERRWRAAQKAGVHEVPVIIRELTDDEAAEVALIENVQRVDLNPVEEARAYRRLADIHGRTQEDIARAVGKSRSHVANVMRLLTLPEEALAALESGALTLGHAKAALGAERPDAICRIALEKSLSVRETEYVVARYAKLAKEAREGRLAIPGDAEKKPAEARKDADTRALETTLAEALGLEVAIAHAKSGAGAVTIRYRDLDQLDDVVRRLTGCAV